MRFLKSTVLLLLISLLFVAPANLESCGPFLPEAVFTPMIGPLGDISDYLRGRFGVVPPTFTMRNLFVAYRYFSGVPLTAEEISALTPPPSPTPNTVRPVTPIEPTAIDLWTQARKAAGAPDAPPVNPYRQVQKKGYFDSFVNCLDDSFHTAAFTLMDRKVKWGPGSANLMEWISGQDRVFSNCDGPRDIPAAVVSTDPLLVADRQYQIAAAAFYAGDWDLARKSFEVVASNSSSPWRNLAPYLEARASIREGTVGGNQEAFNGAERELTALGTPRAKALLGYVAYQAHPRDQLTKVSEELERPQSGPATKQSLTDFVYLETKLRFEHYQPSADLADWIQTYQKGNFAHSIERWHSTSSVPWLVAALASAGKSDAVVPELIAAATAVVSTSPAYPTVNYYAAKLETGAGQLDAARVRVDTLLQRPLSTGSRNLFLAARFKLARAWPEFLKYAPREPSGETYLDSAEQELTGKSRAMLDSDSTSLFDSALPLARWIEAATSPALPVDVRKDLVTAAWTRAIVLSKDAEARTLAAAVQKQIPELAAAMRNYLTADPASAHFAAIYWMLKFPGLTPVVRPGFGRLEKITKLDVLRDNWWVLKAVDPLPDAPFLSAAEWQQGREEWQAILGQAANGANYVASEAIRFVKEHPADPRAPEALALAVRATHLVSVTDQNTGPISKQAFDLLHASYPDSQFARETKYWYK